MSIQYPQELRNMTHDERERVVMNFYVRVEENTLYFCYTYPQFGSKEYIQKTWEVNPEPKKSRIIKVTYYSYRNDEYRTEEIPEIAYNGMKKYHGLDDKDVTLLDEWYETVFEINETDDEGNKRVFSFPKELIKHEIEYRTFESNL